MIWLQHIYYISVDLSLFDKAVEEEGNNKKLIINVPEIGTGITTYKEVHFGVLETFFNYRIKKKNYFPL